MKVGTPKAPNLTCTCLASSLQTLPQAKIAQEELEA